MRLGTLTIAITLLTVSLVGCLGQEDLPGGEGPPDEGPAAPNWAEAALASSDAHDHEDRAQHANMTTPNFQVIGHDPLVTDLDGTSPGGSSCGDAATTADGRRLGAQKMADSRGVVVTDLTDASAPTKLGELVLTGTHIYDVAVVPDGQHIALITSQPKEGPLPTGSVGADGHLGTWESPCTDGPVPVTLGQAVQDPVPRPSSLLLVDISDPANPEIVDQRPITGLGHGVFSTTVDEAIWVMGITENLAEGARHYHLYRLTQGPTGPTLEPLSVYAAEPVPEQAQGLIGHSDAWIKPHPKTDQTLGYLSAGGTFEIVDYSDPTMPERLSVWTDMRDGVFDHNIHSAHALDTLWNGTHYTVVGPELGGPPENGAPTGTVWVLDTTDPTDPKEVAAWTLPHEVAWDGSLQFSTHYLTVHDRTLFVSAYHGGIWAIDLADVDQGTPEDPVLLPSIGVFMPAAEAPHPEGYGFPWTPNLEEVHVLDEANGTLVTYDSNSGVYTFTFDADRPAPPPEPWPIEPLPPANGTLPPANGTLP